MRVDEDAPAARGPAPAEPAAAQGRRARLRAAIQRRMTAEHLIVAVLGLLVLALHDVGYLLSQPYWTDEDWVAVTARFPLAQLPAVTSSTPIGWSVLVRVLTPMGDQAARLLPLAFAGAAVVAAYWLARQLGWRWQPAAVGAGVLAGLGALLVPAMLERNDLKQYTADAFMALLALALTSRLEREWSRRGLAALSVAVWGGMLLSHTVAFVGVAAFGALCVVALARRAWRRLAEAVVVGAGTAVLMLGVYEAFDARAVLPGLTFSPHFRIYYLPLHKGLHGVIKFLTRHFGWVHAYFGLGPAWLAVPLFVAGLMTIFWLGRPATALALTVLWPEMLAISAVHKYPFLDLRTSTFLFPVTAVVAAIGVAGVVAGACSLLRWRPRLRGAAAAGLAAVAAVAFVAGARPDIRSHSIPVEDVQDQAQYVAAHAAPADVILVNLDSNWGFAYYWPVGQPGHRADTAVLQEYEAYFPGQPRIVVARGRDSVGVDSAVSQALARARAQARSGACDRIWLIRTHVSAAESAAWGAALQQHALSLRQVGDHGLSLLTGGSLCR